jgi:hypothetical protein
LLCYERVSKKPLLFKSFTGLTVQEFDDIYNKKIVKRYTNHEIQCLSSIKRKDDDSKRSYGAGRPFKLDVRLKNEFNASKTDLMNEKSRIVSSNFNN